MGASPRSHDVVDACLAMGFASAGVAPARATAYRDELLAWLSQGMHGEMAYLTELLDKRLDVGVMLPNAKSVIIVADQYASGAEDRSGPRDREARGLVARYARGEDYHRVVKRRLHTLADRLRELAPGHEFRSFVDTGPVLEREHAALAGMRSASGDGGGFIGKHTLLIHPKLGSWLLLGGIATTLELEPTGGGELPESKCGGCTRCIDACPTGAITPWRVDARKCISYLTLEHAGDVDDELAARMGSRVIGCDVCQEVCPFNAESGGGASAVNPSYIAGEGEIGVPGRSLPLLDVLNWTDDDRSRVLSRSSAKRATLAMLKRSAVIAALNAWRTTGDQRLREAIAHIAQSEAEPEVVRRAAKRALQRITEAPGLGS